MVECTCINDKNIPDVIPVDKRVVEGGDYTIIRVVNMVKMGCLGCQLLEIDLPDECFPFEFWRLDRFSFSEKDLPALQELINMVDEKNEIVECLHIKQYPILEEETIGTGTDEVKYTYNEGSIPG